jgi:two-component system response regulator PilR (NtrC family)
MATCNLRTRQPLSFNARSRYSDQAAGNPEMAERMRAEPEAPHCAPPDPAPHPPKAKFPPLACDCHAHICGPQAIYGYIPERIYTPPDAPLPAYLDRLEREAILGALAKTGFNRTAAARLLGITFRQLRYRMQRLGIREEN